MKISEEKTKVLKAEIFGLFISLRPHPLSVYSNLQDFSQYLQLFRSLLFITKLNAGNFTRPEYRS